MIKDVRGGADDKPHRRPQQDAEPALDQPAKEGFFDRSVDYVKASLERRVVDPGRNAERAPAPAESKLNEGRRHE